MFETMRDIPQNDQKIFKIFTSFLIQKNKPSIALALSTRSNGKQQFPVQVNRQQNASSKQEHSHEPLIGQQ